MVEEEVRSPDWAQASPRTVTAAVARDRPQVSAMACHFTSTSREIRTVPIAVLIGRLMPQPRWAVTVSSALNPAPGALGPAALR